MASKQEAEAREGTAQVGDYRPDIDGLRCIAVLAVVLSHVELAFGAGGFVGVDVFFVISGFLITGILVRDLREGSYSIAGFYERRARRILPALFVMLLATFAVGGQVLGPDQFVDVARAAVATILFASNVWFWRETSGYFGEDVALAPLLHTWSLGVEEQFYIASPLLLAAIWRLAPQRVRGIAILLTLASLAGAIWQVDSGAGQSAFFLLPTRAWELGLGALLALGAPAVPARAGIRSAVAFSGLAAILIPIVAYTDATPFPGLAAVPPVVGSALLIWVNGAGTNPVKSLLSARPMVAVGLISYSLYLWHWPVIVYAKVVTGALGPGGAAACIAASLVLGALSWRYVERPFRGRRGWLPTRRGVFGASAVAMTATLAVAAVVYRGDGFPGRVAPEVRAVFATARDVDPRSGRCLGKQETIGAEECRIGLTSGGSADFLLWGDSHAAAAIPGVSEAARVEGVSGFAAAFSGCPPLLGVYRRDLDSGNGCVDFNIAVLDFLKRRDDMPLVMLMGRWAFAAEGVPPPGDSGPSAILAETSGRMPTGTPEDNFAIFSAGLAATIAAIEMTGRRVVVVGDVPEIGWSVPAVLGQSLMHHRPPPPGPSAGDVWRRSARVKATFDHYEAAGRIDYLPTISAFCPGARCDVVDAEGRPRYRDGHHLTRIGAVERVAPVIEAGIWR
jgi:peptidoglycan/LPS O-acetylase OafA/YrhL